MAEPKKKLGSKMSGFSDLMVPWIAVVAVGCTVVLGTVDLFYPHFYARSAVAEGPEPIRRWMVTFLGCLIVLFWTSLAVVPGRAAEERGRSGAWWFFASILFGPLVAFIGLALTPVLPKEQGAAVSADEATADDELEEEIVA